MDSTTNQWVNDNLHRQRLLLEEKQRAKRVSSGIIRSSPFDSTGRPSSSFSSSSYSTSTFASPSPMSNTHPLIDLSPSPVLKSTIPGSVDVTPFSEETLTPSPLDFAAAASTHMQALTISAGNSDDDVENGSDGNDEECARAAVSPRIDEKDGLLTETMIPIKEPQYDEIIKNLETFVKEPAEEGVTYKCVITRDKNGMDKGMFPTYYLHLETPASKGKKIFLLAARKRKKCKTANYLISIDPTRLLRTGDGFIGKVRSNALGTSFTVYDDGKNPKNCMQSDQIRAELAAVVYDPNVLGFRGPRKMTILTPGLNARKEIVKVLPVSEKDTLLERMKSGNLDNLVKMTNKAPMWSEESQSFVLNFHGRVTQASVKNFQIVHEKDEEYVVMQFGRVSQDAFSMDFRYPLSAVQAFGIAMTSFHGKIACE